MDAILAILIGILIYIVLCVIITFVRAIFSKPQKRKESFNKTFGTFFFEILNPLNWLS